MKKKSIYVFVIVLLGILLLRNNDYYLWEENSGGYTDEYEEADQENYKGLVASAGDLELKAGSYRLWMDSENWEENANCFFEIVDAQSNGMQIQEELLYSWKYDVGTSIGKVYEFVLEKDAEHLYINSYSEGGGLGLSDYKIESVKPYFTDTYFLAAVWIMLCGIFFWKYEWFVSKKAKSFWIVCGVAAAVSLPLLTDFLAEGHDIWFHLQRVKGMTMSLQAGDQFPIRVNMLFNNGYGLLNPIMYPEMFLYIPAILGTLGVSLLVSVKFLLILVNFCTGLIAYYSMKTIANERTALAFAILYLLSPYRLNNLFIRFALGEFLAMAFVPLLFAGVYHIILGDEKKWWMAVLGCTGIIQSHILTTEMSAIFVGLFVLLNIGALKNFQRVIQGVKAVASTILLNLWYLVPFLSFMGWNFRIASEDEILSETGLYLGQMFMTTYYPEDNKFEPLYHRMELSVGIALLIGLIAFLIYKKQITDGKHKIHSRLLHSCVVLGILTIYMSLKSFPWELVYEVEALAGTFSVIQFSWRFLIFVTLFLCVITAFVWDWSCENKKVVAGAIGLTAVYAAWIIGNGYFFENEAALVNKSSRIEGWYYMDYYSGEEDYRESIFDGRGNIVTTDPETGLLISDYNREMSHLEFNFTADHLAGVQEYTMTFPYYNYGLYGVWIDGEPIETFSDDHTLLSVRLPGNVTEGHVEVKYVGRDLYMFSDGISIITVLIMLGILMYRQRGRR